MYNNMTFTWYFGNYIKWQEEKIYDRDLDETALTNLQLDLLT